MEPLPQGILRTEEGFHVLESDSHLSKWIAEHKRLDVAKGEIMQDYARLIPPGGTVVDAGASLGDHAYTYAQLVGPKGHVYAFEPNPLPFECLKRNMEQFPWVECTQAALGNFCGSAKFRNEINAGASFVSPDGFEVAVIRLDYPFERLDFIHLDAEGFEPFILEGALETIRHSQPAIALEINRSHLRRYGKSEADIRGIMKALSYRVQELSGTPESEQRDILCLPI